MSLTTISGGGGDGIPLAVLTADGQRAAEKNAIVQVTQPIIQANASMQPARSNCSYGVLLFGAIAVALFIIGGIHLNNGVSDGNWYMLGAAVAMFAMFSAIYKELL